MTRPADIPQWAWDEAVRLVKRLFSEHDMVLAGDMWWEATAGPIARALLAAYERGRGEQREAFDQIIRRSAEPDFELDNESDPSDLRRDLRHIHAIATKASEAT